MIWDHWEKKKHRKDNIVNQTFFQYGLMGVNMLVRKRKWVGKKNREKKWSSFLQKKKKKKTLISKLFSPYKTWM